MNREALTIVRTAFVILRSSYATPELYEAVEKLTELGLDPVNTRVQQQTDALIRVRDVIRSMNILKDAPRLGERMAQHGKPGAASPAEPPALGGAHLSVIEGGAA